MQRQLLFFGRIARLPNSNPARQVVFQPDTIDLMNMGARRQQRPRNTWGNEFHKIVSNISRSMDSDILPLILDEIKWKEM